MKKTEITVKGMKCTGCENRICNVLKGIDGVTEVTASFELGKVTITSEKEIDLNEVYKKIENLDFEVIKED